MRNVPWAGLIALLLMLLLPSRLFEGPRTVRHRPTRHVCADCGAPWVAGHTCRLDPDTGVDDDSADPIPDRPLRADVQRLHKPKELPRPSPRSLRRRSS
jgi:hypothetical protein